MSDEPTQNLLKEVANLKNEIKQLKSRKRYGLIWEDKPEDVIEICKEKLPVLVENTDKEIVTDNGKPTNILIEGENYHALSVLNYTHQNKIDVIYIDPPYNTGNASWRYNNKIVDAEDAFRHSKFISFLQHRLKVAKNLLSRSGILVLTIDDYEIHTCRLLLDEIFGEKNRLGTVVIVQNPRGRNDDKYFATMHEYALFYAKNREFAEIKKFGFTNQSLLTQFPNEDAISNYGLVSFMRTGNNSDRHTRPNLFYSIYWRKGELSLEKKKGSIELLPINERGEEKTWRWSKGTFLATYKTEILIKEVKGKIRLFKKRRPEIVGGTKPKTIWYDPKYDASSHGVVLLDKLFNKRGIFPYPKSLYAVMDTLKITTNKNDIILDFFAGSGTTGHAVLQLNKEDGGKRRFILCTNNENDIATEVCYPRIKKVIGGYKRSDGKKIAGLGGNLKYYKTDFVEGDATDKNKKNLVDKSTEMLCLKEDCFERVKTSKHFKIFKNHEGKYLGVIYEDDGIEQFKKEARRINKNIIAYIFSLDDSAREEDFEDIDDLVELKPIPSAVLNIYKRLFK